VFLNANTNRTKSVEFCWLVQGWGAAAGAILFFLQEPEHFKKIGMKLELA